MAFIVSALCSIILNSDYQNSEYLSRSFYPSSYGIEGWFARKKWTEKWTGSHPKY